MKRMKMKNIAFLLLIFNSICSFAQIYEKYPEKQDDYYGGNVGFYKDFHNVLMERKMKPCENKNEFYSLKIVVYPDKTIKYVKDEDSVNVANNKCTFDLARGVIKYMNRWKPAVVEGKEVSAITSFMIIPDDLFNNYKEGYDAMNTLKMPEYEGGINNFRKKVFQTIDLSRFKYDQEFRLTVTFVIDKEGKMTDVRLVQSSGLKEFDDMIVKNISRIKNKWTPAKIHDNPVIYKFNLPLTFRIN